MISINTLLVEYEQDIKNSINKYDKKVREIDNLLSNKRKNFQKKITSTRDKYKKAKYKVSVLEKKLKKSKSKSLQQSLMNAQKKLFQASASLENLILEIEDIKTHQKTIKSSKNKSARIKKNINSILMK